MSFISRNIQKMKLLFATFIIFMMQLTPLVAVTQPVVASGDEPTGPVPVSKVTICHATDSQTNPYITNKPNTSGDVNGHDAHHTEAGNIIWFEGIETKWDDIIPPFYYQDKKDDPVLYYEGKNWTVEGQAIWNNGCNMPGKATLEVVKNLSPVNDEGLFNLYIDRTEYATDVGHRGTTEVQSVEAGDRVVRETAGTDTKLIDYTTSFVCKADGGEGEIVEEGTRTGLDSRQITVEVESGDNIRCIISNTRIVDEEPDPGVITITKYIDEDGDGKADRTATEGEWSFKLGRNDPVNTDSNGQVVFKVEESGDYTITEQSKDGYVFLDGRGTNCKINDSGVGTASVVVGDEGYNAECTFLNQEIQYGSITIEKIADPETDKEFGFMISNGDRNAEFFLVDDGTDTKNIKVFENLEAGVYTVQEKSLEGWDLKNIRCTGDDDVFISVDRNGVKISLDEKEDVKCYFINDRLPITFVASKIVCTDESELPNWGTGNGLNISDQTAIDWVNNHESCELAEGWEFQWSFDGVGNPGDNVEYGGEGWNTFGLTDEFGQTSVDIDDMGEFTRLWFREVFRDGYIPFTYGVSGNSDNVSAEFYCHTDVLNFDNWDWIDNAQYGQSYYCVAWNVALSNLTVSKYEDMNLDGVRNYGDDPEPGLKNWTFTLYDDEGNQVGSDQVTGKKGRTIFKDLAPGEYTVCESMPWGWFSGDLYHDKAYENEDGQICKDVVMTGGKNTKTQFGNYQLGKVLVNKYEDLNINGERDFEDKEPGLSGWEFNIYDSEGTKVGSTKETGSHGWTKFKNLVPGDYTICEILQENWFSSDLIFNDAFEGLFEDEVCMDVTVGSGETVKDFRFGNYQNGSVTVYKYHDLNQNGEWDEEEPALEGWEFNLNCWNYSISDSKSIDSEFESPCVSYGPKTTDVEGEATFEDVKPGHYLLSEELQDGWLAGNVDCSIGGEYLRNGLYSPYGTHHVYVEPGAEVECYVGNYQEAELLIEKTNNQIGNVLASDDTVIYTITVTNPETSGVVYDAVVSDLLPDGLEYVSGTWEVVSSVRGDITGDVPEPDYTTDGPALWELGDLAVGEVVNLYYSVVISDGVSNGVYENIAFVAGEACEMTDYYPEEVSFADVSLSRVLQGADYEQERERCPGYWNETTEILGNLGNPFVLSAIEVANLDEPDEGFVLGTLSTTGNPAILTVALGSIIAIIGVSLTRRKKFNLSKMLQGMGRSSAMMVLGILLGGFVMLGSASAASQMTVSQLTSPTNLSALTLTYQVATTNSGDNFVVTLDVDGPGANDYSVLKPMVAGSHSGNFQVSLPVEGSYEVTVSTDTGLLNKQTIVRDVAAPVVPTYNGVTRDGNTYTLSFQAGSSSDTVLIYASTSTEFTANSATQVGQVSGDKTSFVYVAPDSAQRFFALRTVDSAGNTSPLVGDSETVVTPPADDSSTTVTTANGTDDGTVSDEAAVTTTDVAGTTDDATTDEESDSSQLAWVVAIVGLVLVAGAYVYSINKKPSKE